MWAFKLGLARVFYWLYYCHFPMRLLLFALCPLLSAWAQPNILLILADDCTFSDLAIYGGQNAKTPNIDRLAAEGMIAPEDVNLVSHVDSAAEAWNVIARFYGLH